MKPASRHLQTFASATLSAIALLTGTAVQAHTWCVNSATDFRAKLQAAEANGEDDTIQLARGTYLDAGNEFSFNSTETFSLVITGGYDAGCTHTARDPHLTILDGGMTTQVLSTQSRGSVAVRYVTIQNGMRVGSSGGGLQMNGTGPASEAILAVSILRNNASDYAVGAAYIGVDGPIHVNGNLVTGNRAPNNGGFYIYVGTTSLAYVTNNTFVGNSVVDPTGGDIVFVNYTTAAIPNAYFTNNIFWNNDAAVDLDVYDDLAQLVDNDYAHLHGVPATGSSGNVSVDPLFAGASDYHLSAASPLLGAGMPTPTGGLPSVDLDGNPRTFGGLIDFGAYERGDLLFADGFEP